MNTMNNNMSTISIVLTMAALSTIVSACAVEVEVREQAGSEAEAAIQAKATAALEAQAAAGNRDAQEVLRGIERFRQLYSELAGDGTVVPGERDVEIAAAMMKRQEAGQLAEGTLCDDRWRTMIHGQTSLKLKVVEDGTVFDSARVAPLSPGEEGRELFLFCRDEHWAENHHLIWSNAGGNYLTTRGGGVRVRFPEAPIFDPPVDIPELFDIKNLDQDASWSYFKAVAGGYAQPFKSWLYADSSYTLNGNALWRCSPGNCTTRFGRR